jgi:hypothetical protein
MRLLEGLLALCLLALTLTRKLSRTNLCGLRTLAGGLKLRLASLPTGPTTTLARGLLELYAVLSPLFFAFIFRLIFGFIFEAFLSAFAAGSFVAFIFVILATVQPRK